MELQKIIWTVLPNGYNPGDPSKLRFSVFVSPRLSSTAGSPKLAPFGDFLDWPAALNGIDFHVQFGNNAPVPATRVGPPMESALWKAMFDGTAKVDPYEFQAQDAKVIRSYPFVNVYSWIKDQYQDIVLDSPTVLPESAKVAAALEPLMFYEKPVSESEPIDSKTTSTVGFKARSKFTNTARISKIRAGGKFAERLNRGSTWTRLQTTRIHPQLEQVLTDVNENVFLTATMDMQFLTQDPTVVFKATTVSTLKSIYSELATNKAMNYEVASNPAKDFLQVSFFHRPKSPGIVAIAVPSIDFHEAVASLGNYPEIMKRVGLVIELEVDAASAGGDTVRLLPVKKGMAATTANLWTGTVSTENVRPRTAYEINAGAKRFRPKAKPGSQLTNGLLNVSSGQYKLVNLDVDGAAMKMMGLANTLRHFAAPNLKPPRLAGNEPIAMSQLAPTDLKAQTAVVEEVGLPALRTSAITLVKTNYALNLVSKLVYVTALNMKFTPANDNDAVLYLDDVVAGYRVDAWDSMSNSWHSLCKRKGTYTFTKIAETRNYDDEGFIELGVGASADEELEELKDTYYLPEVVASWDGWSKVAPPPGKAIIQGDDPNESHPAEDDTWMSSPGSPSNDYGLDATFKVQPGTLPRLRYGKNYRLRLRAVDLAGNGLTLEEAPTDATAASEQITFTRFEPIPSPYLVPKTAIKPGESVEHVAIRSNYNTTAAEYASIFPVPDHPAYPSERHVVPPRQAQRPAEQHGFFDDPVTGKPRPDLYNQITSNDGFYTPFDAAQASKAVRPEAKIDVPWLPDVARGATFRGLPGVTPGGITKIDFGPFSNWPDLDPFIIRLVEGEGAPEGPVTEGTARVVTVKLPKAAFTTCLYSSNLAVEDLQKMAVWEWLKQAGSPSQQQALDGLNWSLTPYRGITFIHVTQQPVEEPDLKSMKADKELGDTFAMLSGEITLHGASTAQLDLYAEWVDPVDDLNVPRPKWITKKNLALQENIDLDDTALNFPPKPEDAKSPTDKMKPKGAISVIGAAKSYTSYVAQNDPNVAAQVNALSTQMKGTNLAKTSSVKSGGGDKKAMEGSKDLKLSADAMQFALLPGITVAGMDLIAKLDGRRRHDFRDTKHRMVKYRPVATSRFREYFLDVIAKATPPGPGEDRRTVESDTKRGMITRTGEDLEVNILSSARPDAPKVLYAIPTFAWEKEESPSEITSKRVTGLRIYMERPWFSSGEDEMLGVIIWPTTGSPKKTSSNSTESTDSKAGGKYVAKTDIKSRPAGSGSMLTGMSTFATEESVPDKLLPYVTQWGADPLWMAGRLRSLPKVSDFLNTAATDTGLSLEEFPSKNGDEFVSVAAYKVGYDESRRLWFCDIEIDPHEAYYPFIRLALARYQKHSVADAHLSRVVQADFIQIAPDRSATLTFDTANPKKVRVGVTGVAYRASAAGQFPSEVEITVETATGPVGDLQWIPAEDYDPVMLDRLGGLGQKVWEGLWAGEVMLPFNRGTQAMRLVVREFEVLLADGFKLPRGFDTDGATAEEIATAIPEPVLRRRLVYADVIEL